MHRFEYTQHLAAPPAAVMEFFSDARHLDSNTPGYFRIHLREGEVGLPLRANQLFHYRFELLGVPIPWTTEITEVRTDRFVDVQRTGPYRSFEHLHLFLPAAGGTMMIDRVLYSLWLSPLSAPVNAFFVRPLLEGIFMFRARVAAERFGELPV